MSNKNKKLRVFHGLVNYGTQAGLLAKYIREQGVEALSVSFPDKSKRLIDIELLFGGNVFQKIIKHAWNWLRRFFWFFRYNTFHLYYGTSLFPYQIDLPLYRLFGKKVIKHYLGNDVQGYKKSVDKYKWTNMTGFIDEKDSHQYDRKISRRLKFETKYVDLQLVCAPIYSEFVDKSVVIPLGVDLKSYTFTQHPENEILIIMHSPTHRGSKGTDYIVAAVEKLISEGYELRFNLVENVTHSQLKEEYKKADIFVDQIISGWYGTASIEAMALGRPVICSVRQSYFKYIDYGHKIPILHADPDSIYSTIKYVLENKDKLPEFGVACRKYVEEIHDIEKISGDLVGYYRKLWL